MGHTDVKMRLHINPCIDKDKYKNVIAEKLSLSFYSFETKILKGITSVFMC